MEGKVNLIMVGKKTGNVYYVRNRILYAFDLDTKATREIGKLPPGGSISTVNADETLAAGSIMPGWWRVGRLREKVTLKLLAPSIGDGTQACAARG